MLGGSEPFAAGEPPSESGGDPSDAIGASSAWPTLKYYYYLKRYEPTWIPA